MKLAIVTDGIYPYVMGGMQKHSFYLAKFLVRQGVDVTLVHCVPHNQKLPSEREVQIELDTRPGDQFISYCLHFPAPGAAPGHYLKESYAYSKKVYAVLADKLDTFDFIYIKGFAGWDLIRRRLKGQQVPPLGVKFHGYEMFQPAPSFKLRLQHWMLRGPTKYNNVNADVIFSYGGYITPLVQRIGVKEKSIIEIPTGIEAAWVRDGIKPTSGRRSLLFIGRFERRKGVEELSSVLSELIETEDFDFHFVGPIPPTRYIKSDRITYHGKVMKKEALQEIVDGCDVLVTPSHSEGMPNVIMEGMARGLAVIATDVGAVPDQVDEVNGWRLAPGDRGALKKAILEAVHCSPEELDQKKQASRKRVLEHFTWEQVAAQTCSEIEGYLGIAGSTVEEAHA